MYHRNFVIVVLIKPKHYKQLYAYAHRTENEDVTLRCQSKDQSRANGTCTLCFFANQEKKIDLAGGRLRSSTLMHTLSTLKAFLESAENYLQINSKL
jgi:hypothetical protein